MKNFGHLAWDDFEKQLFKQPGFKEAVEETRLEFETAKALIKARIERDSIPVKKKKTRG